MNHFATPDFWFCHRHLPPEIRELADKNFGLVRDNPPSRVGSPEESRYILVSAGGVALPCVGS